MAEKKSGTENVIERQLGAITESSERKNVIKGKVKRIERKQSSNMTICILRV